MDQKDKQEILSAIAGLTEGQESLAEALQGLATHMDERFDGVDRLFERLEGRVGTIEMKMPQLVTKDYLDRKLANLHGETVFMIRRALSPSS